MAALSSVGALSMFQLLLFLSHQIPEIDSRQLKLDCLVYENLYKRTNDTEPWRHSHTEKKRCQGEWCLMIEGVGTMSAGNDRRQLQGQLYGCAEAGETDKLNLCSQIGNGCRRFESIFGMLFGDFRLCCCDHPGCWEKFERKLMDRPKEDMKMSYPKRSTEKNEAEQELEVEVSALSDSDNAGSLYRPTVGPFVISIIVLLTLL